MEIVKREGTQCPGEDALSRPMYLQNMMEPALTKGDQLHSKAFQPQTSCTTKRCLGSFMVDPIGFPNRKPRSQHQTLAEARDFVQQFYAIRKSEEVLNMAAMKQRLGEVTSSIEKTGAYQLTYDELVYGCKTAWRNASRCIGRIQWNNLQVFDARHIKTAKEMYEALLTHLEYSTNGGNIRSAITMFPQRTAGTTNRDFKIWNSLLLGYAGYRKPDGSTWGDAKNIEFTELCQKLGWKSKGGMFDILPLVLQADGNDPELFEIPQELVLEVQFTHPGYPKFDELGLRWVAVPGVANMCFDCGGLEFTGCQFSGWYMSTEVAARDLCDTGRYNMLKEIAEACDIAVGGNTTLWKDKALLEVNLAVLQSYNVSGKTGDFRNEKQGVTIIDHHSASESFMTHLSNEQKLRGGCPADWVWIVPPISSSLTKVFHQEMLNYKLKPSYEYQAPCWTLHKWKNPHFAALFKSNSSSTNFKAFAVMVWVATSMIKKMMAKRPKCLVLFATETGRSEMFGSRITDMLHSSFNVHMTCMKECTLQQMMACQLVLVVTSTFGNGDAPANGEKFQQILQDAAAVERNSSKKSQSCCFPLVKAGRVTPVNATPFKALQFSVFGLGSRAYPHFCQFAHTIRDLLSDLGANELYPLSEGDELEGQEEPFKDWATGVFQTACDMYRMDSLMVSMVSLQEAEDTKWVTDNFRLVPVHSKKHSTIVEDLSDIHKKKIQTATFLSKMNLQSSKSSRKTLLVKLRCAPSVEMKYEPGDHLALFPGNNVVLVQNLMNMLIGCPNSSCSVRLERQRGGEEGEDSVDWEEVERLPECTLEDALTHYLDITTPPSQTLLSYLADLAVVGEEKDTLTSLAHDHNQYKSWKNQHWPNLCEVLSEFPSLQVPASLLICHLPLLQPRYYSISSSLRKHPTEVHLTVALLQYTTPAGSVHQGVCSSWLETITQSSTIPCYIRQSHGFHLPDLDTSPIIMVGPGTGIAPFRSFWQERAAVRKENTDQRFGPMELYFGCRRREEDHIYQSETNQALRVEILSKVHVAYSREKAIQKTYVQDILLRNKRNVYKTLHQHKGHFYVCGDVTMAADVNDMLLKIFKTEGHMSAKKADQYFNLMKNENRYHEDIFGAGFKSPTDETQV